MQLANESPLTMLLHISIPHNKNEANKGRKRKQHIHKMVPRHFTELAIKIKF